MTKRLISIVFTCQRLTETPRSHLFLNSMMLTQQQQNKKGRNCLIDTAE